MSINLSIPSFYFIHRKMFLKFNLASIALFSVAAAATFSPLPSNAVCVNSNSSNNCVTFDPSSKSGVIFSGYTDSVFVANDRLTDISFTSVGYTTPDPLIIESIQYSFDGINFVSLGSAQISPSPGTTGNLLSSPVLAPGGQIGSNFILKATYPANIGPVPSNPLDAHLEALIKSNNPTGFEPQTQTRDSTALDIPTPVPGPLPLFGAITAFGFSRKLRSKISSSSIAS